MTKKTKKLVVFSLVVVLCVLVSVVSAQTYNGNKAAAYAYKNAKNGVPGSWYFAYAGGDCTNFASQSLKAGGWTMKDLGHTNDLSWYYVSYAPFLSSHTWGGADNFHSYLARSGRASTSNIYSLEKGDIAQIDYGCDNVWEHTMIVTDKRNGEIYLCYHTPDNKDVSFTTVKERAERQAREIGEEVQFCGWHIKSQF